MEKDKTENNVDYIGISAKLLLPLEMIWRPKEDITAYELAMCLKYLFRGHGVMPYEVDKSLPYFRHFEIIDHNN
jgi:hypothetical protein